MVCDDVQLLEDIAIFKLNSDVRLWSQSTTNFASRSGASKGRSNISGFVRALRLPALTWTSQMPLNLGYHQGQTARKQTNRVGRLILDYSTLRLHNTTFSRPTTSASSWLRWHGHMHVLTREIWDPYIRFLIVGCNFWYWYHFLGVLILCISPPSADRWHAILKDVHIPATHLRSARPFLWPWSISSRGPISELICLIQALAEPSTGWGAGGWRNWVSPTCNENDDIRLLFITIRMVRVVIYGNKPYDCKPNVRLFESCEESQLTLYMARSEPLRIIH